MADSRMPFFVDHVWIMTFLVLGANLAIGHYRARALIRGGLLTKKQANDFVKGTLLVFLAVFGALEIISLATGVSVVCINQLPWLHPAVLLNLVVILLSWSLLLLWVWRGGGAETLARIAPAFTNGRVEGRRFRPNRVRWFVTFIVLVVTVGQIASITVKPKHRSSFVSCTEQ